jgi:NAD(P)-dependent dehydrogenase (short-subunit alcohol dehydrogenase family)
MIKTDMKGKIALVTGAASGLARATAEVLASNGASIAILEVNKEAAEKAAAEISEKYGVECSVYISDITDYQKFEEVFKKIYEKYGKLDICVNIAGYCAYKSYETVTQEEIDRMIKMNINGQDNAGRLCLKYMGNQTENGVCVFNSSVAGRSGQLSFPHYSMTKAAVINMTQSFALAGARRGVRFVSVCPGIIRTDFWNRYLHQAYAGKEDAAFAKITDAMIPMGVPQEPIDIANAICFLASDEARYITGQSLNVCGGMALN